MSDYFKKSPYYKATPGLVLGPLESFVAMSEWTRECIDNFSEKEFKFMTFGDRALGQLPEQLKSHAAIKHNGCCRIIMFLYALILRSPL